MDTNHPLLSLIEELGFPIVTTLGVAGGMWFIVKWLMNTLTKQVQDVQEQLTRTQSEQYNILVKLIDRIRSMEDSITRIEIIIRTVNDLQQEWGRIGKAQDNLDKND